MSSVSGKKNTLGFFGDECFLEPEVEAFFLKSSFNWMMSPNLYLEKWLEITSSLHPFKETTGSVSGFASNSLPTCGSDRFDMALR